MKRNTLNAGLFMPPQGSNNVQCSYSEWVLKNGDNLEWYYSNYPQLVQRGITLPADPDKLKAFYLYDMANRNLSPQRAWLDCYGALFSYLLGRIDGTIVFEGRSWWELTMQNLPGAVSKTFKSITNPLGIPITYWLLGTAAIIIATKI